MGVQVCLPLKTEQKFNGGVDIEAHVRPLLVILDPALPRVFNKPVEKFVEKPTPHYGKVKSMNGF